MIRSIFVLAIVFGASPLASSKGVDEEVAAEVRSYAEAAKRRLENKSPYDITAHIEQSIKTEGRLIPIGKIAWRIRHDQSKERVFYAADHKRLPPHLALKGSSDGWITHSSILQVLGPNAETYLVDGGVLARKFESFAHALDGSQAPFIPLCGQVELIMATANRKLAREKLDRILGMAEEVTIKHGATEGKPTVTVHAVISDDRMIETHQWVYAKPRMEPMLYEITQDVTKTGNPKTIHSESITWNNHPHYDRIPTESRSISAARYPLSNRSQNPESKPEYLYAKKLSVVKLSWRRFSDDEDFDPALIVASADEFEQLFD